MDMPRQVMTDSAPMDTLRNFPPQMTSFVGRAQEIRDISALLDDDSCRLVTLVGPGGIGKTRLALEIARRLDFADGLYYVPLQPLRAVENIVTAILSALSLQLGANADTRVLLLNYLREKQLLLVLDNFEHLLDGVDILSDILRSTTRVKLLVTSRERLNLRTEQVWPVRGLDVPQDRFDLSDLPSAAQLFDERARRVQPDFDLADHQKAVTDICRLVEGMPLALELAASWIRAMPCELIAEELRRDIDILMTSQRDVPQRHQSIRAVFDHSWHLLSEDERAVFRNLSVFRGGFTLDAAQQVAGANWQTLVSLVDKSLVRPDDNGRYDLHELLRQYAKERLEDSGKRNNIRDRHCHYYADLFYDRRSDQCGPGKEELLHMFTGELDNIRATWAWALQREQYDVIDQLIELLWMYFTDHMPAFELGDLCQAAVDQLAAYDSPRERAILGRVLARQGKWACWQSNFERAEMLFHESMAIALEQDNRDEYYYALRWFATHVLFFMKGDDLSGVQQLLEECAAFYREQGNKAALALTFFNLAAGYRWAGDIDHSRQLLLECLQLNQEMAYPQGIARTMTYLGRDGAASGRWSEAERWLSEALERQRQLGDRFNMRFSYQWRGSVAVMQGDFSRAEPFLKAALGARSSSDSTDMNLFDFETTIAVYLYQGLIADATGKSVDGLELVEESLAAGGRRAGFSVDFGRPVYGLVLCGLKRFDTALQQLVAYLSATQVRYQRGHVNKFWRGERLLAIPLAACILAHRADWVRAVELLGSVFGDPCGPRGYLENHQGMTQLRADLEAELGPDAYSAAWEQGQAMDVDAVFAELRNAFLPEDHPEDDSAFSQHTYAVNRDLPEPLTPRELEILQRITHGLSNDELADDLVISVTTVKKHITHIYGKLNVQRRAQAIAWAREQQLFQ